MSKEFKDLSELKQNILILSAKFIADWGGSPSMGFIAGRVRPLVTVARIAQALEDLEKDGFIERLPGKKYHKGFRVIEK